MRLHFFDSGPWSYCFHNGKHAAASDDFTHDVVIVINGDFRDDDQKRRYAHALADELNFAQTSQNHAD